MSPKPKSVRRSKTKASPNFLDSAKLRSLQRYLQQCMHPDLLRNIAAMDTDILPERADIFIDSFWAKYASRDISIVTGSAYVSPKDRKSKAIAKWLATEKRNANTNARMKTFTCDFGFATSEKIIDLARRYALETIGLKPPANPVGEFTGGASTRVKRGPGAIASKFAGKAHSSTTALPFWFSHVVGFTNWWQLNPETLSPTICNRSEMFTVPKNSDIDRVACKEPEINMYLQRSYGLHIRKCLKRKGIDLQDQSRNRKLALEGSRWRGLATLDLSSASDTISTELVRMILPSQWFEVLDAMRVKNTILPDRTEHTLEMFSSMGNGFTFELESLIFWVLTRAVSTLIRARGKISVFGDDIICPKPTALALTRVLPFFGFKINLKKSRITGPVRESCGGWYAWGMDVTPVFFRERLASKVEVIRLGNQLLEWMLLAPLEMRGYFGTHLRSVWDRIYDAIPAYLHGGQSFEQDFALVTGDAPRRRLVQLNEPVEIDQLGGYLQWLHTKEVKPNVVSSPTDASQMGRWVVRPNLSWYVGDLMWDVAHFCKEQSSPSEPPVRGPGV